MKLLARLVGLLILGGSSTLHADSSTEAREGAWKVAQSIVEKIAEADLHDCPGLNVWRREFLEAGKNPLAVDADKLVTRNDHWWVAYYEVAPGDPALMLLHCELLLAGGEAQRSQQLAAIYLQRPGIPELYRDGLRSVIGESVKAQAPSTALTQEGIALHDRGDFDGAIAKYDAALKAWPANGWTAYERGFSMYVRALTKAGKPIPKNGTLTINDKSNDDLPEKPEIAAAYAASRQHDPLQMTAYQGGAEMKKPLLAMLQQVLPAWEKIRADVSKPLDEKTFAQLASGLQETGAHEYALAARQVIIARRRKFAPVDHPILSQELRALAPSAAIERTLSLLAGRTMPARVFVPPEPGFEMLAAKKKK
jgi:tetratricopeptide (TPR) repeat protein